MSRLTQMSQAVVAVGRHGYDGMAGRRCGRSLETDRDHGYDLTTTTRLTEAGSNTKARISQRHRGDDALQPNSLFTKSTTWHTLLHFCL